MGKMACDSPLPVLAAQTDLLHDALSLSLSSYSCCPCCRQPPRPLATAHLGTGPNLAWVLPSSAIHQLCKLCLTFPLCKVGVLIPRRVVVRDK